MDRVDGICSRATHAMSRPFGVSTSGAIGPGVRAPDRWRPSGCVGSTARKPLRYGTVRDSASGGIVFRHAEAIPQRVEHVDEQGPEPGLILRLILARIVRAFGVASPRVREWLPVVRKDSPFQAVTLVRVRDVFEVHGPAQECDTAQGAPSLDSSTLTLQYLQLPFRCVSRNFTGIPLILLAFWVSGSDHLLPLAQRSFLILFWVVLLRSSGLFQFRVAFGIHRSCSARQAISERRLP
jgi:hypothetical protein